MRVITIPCLKDNYAYLLVDASKRGVVIDPSEGAPVLETLRREGVDLTAIWLTHHHWDHVGGIEALCAAYPNATVLGSRHDAARRRIPHQTIGVSGGDTLSFADLPVRVLDIPGHTLGAVAFVVGHCLFTGDTLFLAGCGRVFEGTLPQMQASLAALRALDPTLLVYPGHEYTVSNLTFGRTVEPDNEALRKRLVEAQAVRARGEPTVPGRLSDELATNVFLRWDAPAVISYANGAASPAEVFGAVRQAKDRF